MQRLLWFLVSKLLLPRKVLSIFLKGPLLSLRKLAIALKGRSAFVGFSKGEVGF
ncbi:hypothetical protein [uncultured Gammaproteobacteria bacterium]|nr:hypothetical protein [uncultured Gammaproteobacteria bacterium]